MGHFGLAIGMAFQIVDDMLDIIGDEGPWARRMASTS